MNHEAFDRDASIASSTRAAELAQTPTLALACRGPFANLLQRQVAAAGLLQLNGAFFEGCTHWIFEENAAETLSSASARKVSDARVASQRQTTHPPRHWLRGMTSHLDKSNLSSSTRDRAAASLGL